MIRMCNHVPGMDLEKRWYHVKIINDNKLEVDFRERKQNHAKLMIITIKCTI